MIERIRMSLSLERDWTEGPEKQLALGLTGKYSIYRMRVDIYLGNGDCLRIASESLHMLLR